MTRMMCRIALFPIALLVGCGSSSVGNLRPSVVVTAPAQDQETASDGGSVTIVYTDNDPDDVASTDLLADQDGDPFTVGDQIVIASARPEMDGVEQMFVWSVSAAPVGTYRIVAVTRDGSNVAVGVASGRITLNAASTITILEPATDHRLSRGSRVWVDYIDDDPDDVALSWITADLDGNPDTVQPGDVTSPPRPDGDGALQRVRLGLDAVGDFRVLGTTWDGANHPALHMAPGVIEVRNVAWAKAIDGFGLDGAIDVETLPDGSALVTGYFEQELTLGSGDPNQTTLLASGANRDVYIARYNGDGTLAWARKAGGMGSELPTGIGALPDGSCLVIGRMDEETVFGAGEPNETTLMSGGGIDTFVARYSPDGTLDWVRQITGLGDVRGNDVTGLADGGLVVTGSFVGTAMFDAVPLVASNDDMYIARYAGDGSLDWARRAGGTDLVWGVGVSGFVDGAFVVTGRFVGTATFGPGEAGETVLAALGQGDMFLASFQADGTLDWVIGEGGVEGDGGSTVVGHPDGTILVGGLFRETATFGAMEPNETTLVAAGGTDAYLAHYDDSGALLWVTSAGGGGGDAAQGIALHADGTIAVTGYTLGGLGPVTFGLGEARETTLTPLDGDAFLARYEPDGTLLWARGVAEGLYNSQAGAVAVHADGSSVVVGSFEFETIFGRSAPRETPLSSGGQGGFVARYNADGDF